MTQYYIQTNIGIVVPNSNRLDSLWSSYSITKIKSYNLENQVLLTLKFARKVIKHLELLKGNSNQFAQSINTAIIRVYEEKNYKTFKDKYHGPISY